ncbi:MAG: TraR/DksA C4-type zinc finger protein [Candidatus Staskawiczbacteria bacterium]|nr:TraR/DksA C4-type zinc finger protein [Candidatus Staskawiczbacteria bacterium]
MKKELVDELKTKLEEQKNSVQKELESFASEDPNLKHNWEAKFPNREDGDKDEKADDAQEYDNMLSLEYSLEIKLKDIKLALEKIEAGKYGLCEKCGKEIEEERLMAAPEAKLHMKCNSK